MARRHAQLVFAHELLDLRRERRVLRRLFLQPLAFIALMAAPALLVQQAAERDRKTTFTVAVQGDVDAIPGLQAALDRPPFHFARADRAAAHVVGRRADVAVVIPTTAEQSVAAGRTVRLDVLSFSTQDVSERAGPALVRRLVEFSRDESADLLVAAGQPTTLGSPLRVVTEDVASTSVEGVRFSIAQALPALLVIQLFGLVALSQERIAGAKDKRLLEPLLLLPIPRRDLALGIGSATLVVGSVSALVVFVPLTIGLSGFVAAASRSLAGPSAVVLTLAAGSIALASTFVALGLYLGGRAGSGSEGSVFVTVVQLVLFSTVVIAPFLTEVDATGPVLAVPVLGPMLFVRDGIAGSPDRASLAILLASQAAIAVLVLARAARALDGERNVLRAARA